MKNCLDYYYDIKINDIHHVKNEYRFKIDSYDYIFFEYDNSEEQAADIYYFSNNLLNRGIYCHQILLNKEGKVITIVDNKQYILMRFYQNLDKKVTIEEMLMLNKVPINSDKFNHANWQKLWESKIDYLEYQINHFGNNHPLLRNSFNYFSGFVETGIQLLNTINIKIEKTVLCHKRMTNNMTQFDFYNPFNLIIDCQTRDFCEYIKSEIYQKKNTYDLLELEQLTYMYINEKNLSINDIQLFFIRLLYPSFYFDVFEDFIISKENDYDNQKLNKVLQSISNYEKFVIDIYNYYFNHNWLPLIEWLKVN